MRVCDRAHKHKGTALLGCSFLIIAIVFAVSAIAQTSTTGVRFGPSGLPLPRFVSLKSDEVNIRIGAGFDYDIAWKFVKGRLPIEVTEEFENWRRIRDWEGNVGWVFHSLLSGKRTALVMPWSRTNEALPLYRERNEGSKLNARLGSGKLVDIIECDGEWCRIQVENSEQKTYHGYVKQNQLWGVYPSEEID